MLPLTVIPAVSCAGFTVTVNGPVPVDGETESQLPPLPITAVNVALTAAVKFCELIPAELKVREVGLTRVPAVVLPFTSTATGTVTGLFCAPAAVPVIEPG